MALKWLQTFVIAAKYSNYSKTAEKLYLAQPTVSQHIRNLEKSLDSKLFEKSGRNVELTKVGRLFLPTAQAMLKEFEHGLEEINRFESGFQQKFSCATAPFIASTLMPKFYKHLLSQHPEIDLQLEVVKSMDIETDILMNKVDFGLSRIEPQNKNVAYQKVWEDNIVLVIPNHEDFSNLNFQQLAATHRMLVNDHPYYIEEIIPYLRELYPNLTTMNLTQIDVIKSFLLNAIGYAFLPYSSVLEEITNDKLLLLEIDQLPVSSVSTIYFCYKKSNPAIQAFQQILVDFLSVTKSIHFTDSTRNV
ncbi:LysR family transcriptional regulator [Enterococcus sp. AZ109]|uniref:LysR family transcriptional regulator n=1 Tax=Enterococcus sp. AZ109 TaxID=2774634 RepID=UPI003F2224A0